MLFFYINDVKIDCVLAPFPYLEPIEIIDNIRFVSTPDVIAMKLAAMSSRGVKKDFWDIAELLNHYKLEDMLSFFATKYNAADPFFVVRSLTYFEDAERQIDPQPLKKITWTQVKKKVEKAVKDFLK